MKGDVINVVPPHRAGDIAQKTGLITANQRWCGVDWLTMESVAVKGVHVLADATLSAPAMPKSASMANQHAKVCAAAVIALIKGQPVNQQPMMMNTCYSFVDGKNVMHVASVHTYDAAQKTHDGRGERGGGSFRQGERAGGDLRLGLGEEYLGRGAGVTPHQSGERGAGAPLQPTPSSLRRPAQGCRVTQAGHGQGMASIKRARDLCEAQQSAFLLKPAGVAVAMALGQGLVVISRACAAA